MKKKLFFLFLIKKYKKIKINTFRTSINIFFFQLLILGNKISDINSKIPSFIPTKDTCFV